MQEKKSGGEKYMVIFQPSGRRGYVEKGKSLKEASVTLGVDIEGACGGKGVCGKCKVRIEEGIFEKYGVRSSLDNLSAVVSTEKKFFTAEQEQAGFRLACLALVQGDVVVFVPEESRIGKQVVRKAARNIEIELKPAVKKYYVEIQKATLHDTLGDWERIQNGLEQAHGLTDLVIDYQTLLVLQEVVREGDWKITVSVWQDKEVIKVEPGNMEKVYGLAVDVGTTTVAGYLCDLVSGELLATASMMNPQVVFGEDVMSRISYTMTHPKGLEQMNGAILDGLNGIAADVSAMAGIKATDILDMTIVGNTCMHHLYLNIDPRNIGRAPFAPALHHSLDIKARDVGFKLGKDGEATAQSRDVGIRIAPGAYIHALPIEAGFVGADNVGVLIAEAPHLQDSIELIIDIGTNGELILGNRQKLVSSSCATGPAFEGAEIRFGMRAAPGAIEKIVVDRATKEVRFKVIDREEWNTDVENIGAKGICGSGIIDVVPQLFLAGIVDHTGRFAEVVDSPRFREEKGQREFVIAWARETSIGQDIVVCQDDVRAIQLAKGAMYAGARIMMRTLGVEKVDKVILAGAFGSYIDKVSAALLGLFPDCDLENIYSVGNAAGDGARMALLNVDKRKEADWVARQTQYIELTVEPGFNKMFAQAMWIPNMKDEFPHLAHLLPENK
jgi:uncharacterized 2Fe-2S/4Fe-4S cluster protein (DUF4445 family)